MMFFSYCFPSLRIPLIVPCRAVEMSGYTGLTDAVRCAGLTDGQGRGPALEYFAPCAHDEHTAEAGHGFTCLSSSLNNLIASRLV